MFGEVPAKANELNTNGSTPISSVPEDAVSCLAWSPVANVLAAGSWDKSVRTWDVTPEGVQPKTAHLHEAPVLCCGWSRDGQRLVSGGCDNKVRMQVLETQQDQLIGQHDAAVKEVFVIDENMVVSGSWDKTLRFWDGRQPCAAATLQLPERCYTMDIKGNLMVVGCADRHVLVYNLETVQRNSQPYKQGLTNLKMQTRSISCFADKTGYAVGSVEGRVSIAHIEDVGKNFGFKCHRTHDEVFAVNSIDFHPTMGTFSTAGGDGTVVFWDKENRSRLKQFSTCHYPITQGKFNAPGDMFAYAVSYDWGKGHEGNHPSIPRSILLHRVKEAEVKPKNSSKVRR